MSIRGAVAVARARYSGFDQRRSRRNGMAKINLIKSTALSLLVAAGVAGGCGEAKQVWVPDPDETAGSSSSAGKAGSVSSAGESSTAGEPATEGGSGGAEDEGGEAGALAGGIGGTGGTSGSSGIS